ncbi:unnamed protein product [Hermetia illucens]|uniref:Uncharacterized protein n=1 Tax=Hermetia illucens TaxID=343691 RepID=A0A7R8UY27_HERIL|nr:unnamed protein product [Hermetia illucens]
MKSLVAIFGILVFVAVISTPTEGIRICRKSIENPDSRSYSRSPESKESCEEITIEGLPKEHRPVRHVGVSKEFEAKLLAENSKVLKALLK